MCSIGATPTHEGVKESENRELFPGEQEAGYRMVMVSVNGAAVHFHRFALTSLSAGFLFIGSASAVAGKLDAFLGDWNLNVAKSTFQPMPPMKKYTMKVVDAGSDRLLIKSDWIDSDGTVGHVEYSTSFDGSPVALIDYPYADTVTDIMVSATTWKSVWTKKGMTVEREFETVSTDGQIFREVDEGKDDTGKRYKNRLVFERP